MNDAIKEPVIKSFMKKNEKRICVICGIGLVAMLLLRLYFVYKKSGFVDTKLMHWAAQCIRDGLSPYTQYSVENLAPPLQPPSITTLFMPLASFSVQTISAIVFVLSVCAVAYLMIFVLSRALRLQGQSLFKPVFSNLFIWLAIVLLMQSSPVLNTLRNGQTGALAWAMAFVVFVGEKENKLSWLLLGGSAAIKFSVLTFLAPLIFMQKKVWTCILGFALFVILLLIPGLFIGGVWEGFMGYLTLLTHDVSSGFNSFEGASWDIVCCGIWRIKALNYIMIAAALFLALHVLFRAHQRMNKAQKSFWFLSNNFTMAEMGVVAMITLLVSYHRIHDVLIVLPFLAIVFIDSFKQRNKWHIVINCIIILYWIAPLNVMYKIANVIGSKLMFMERYIYFGQFREMSTLFPISNFLVYMMFLWFVYLTFYESRNKTSITLYK